MKRAETRRRNTEALVRAARRLFLERGYQVVGIEAIAAEAGLTIGAIYSIFGAKHHLLIAVLDELTAGVTSEPATRPGGTAAQVVKSVAREYRRAVDAPGGYRLLRLEVEAMALAMQDDLPEAELLDRVGALDNQLAALLTGRVHGDQTLTKRQTETLGTTLAALLRGLAQQHVLSPRPLPESTWLKAATALLDQR